MVHNNFIDFWTILKYSTTNFLSSAPGEGLNPAACDGDVGGPMVCRNVHNMEQFGILQWAGVDTCGSAQSPGLFRKTAPILKWVQESTGVNIS